MLFRGKSAAIPKHAAVKQQRKTVSSEKMLLRNFSPSVPLLQLPCFYSYLPYRYLINI